MFEAEAEAKVKASRPRPRPRLKPKFWPQGHFGLEDLTSLHDSPSKKLSRGSAIAEETLVSGTHTRLVVNPLVPIVFIRMQL